VPAGFRMGPILSGAALSCSLLFASASFASNLRDVRVGPHGDYTRVVLETDAKASYSLNQSDGVVTIELQASATPKAVTAKSQQLSWVRVEPAGASSVVRIELKGPARVKQMVLTAPHRIVLDVFADGAAAKTPPQREPVAKAAPPPEPAQQPSPASESAAAPSGTAAEEALLNQEADAMLGPAPKAPGSQLAADEAQPDSGAPTEAEAEALEGASGDPATAASPPAVIAPKPAPVRVVQRKPGLLDWFSHPIVLGGLAVLMLGLVVILRRKRPAPAAAKQKQAADESSAASLFATESAPRATAEAAPDAGRGESGESSSATAETVSAESAGDSAFEFEAPDIEPEKPDLGPAQGALLSTIGSVTSTTAFEQPASTATGGLSLPELDRRLALLEQRLEEVIDAKDRLERQVSAQTEELRVQRAAIARTQRVLRTVVRPEDDQASEPVLKS